MLATLRRFLPYLWPKDAPGLRARIVFALGLVVVSKLVQVYGAPFALQGAIDRMAGGSRDAVWLVVALVAGYALLGSTWLILKTEGRVQALARQMTRPLVVAVIAAMGLVSSWLPFLDSRLMARWFSDGNFWWLSPVPLLTLAVAAALWRSATHPRRDLPPFLLSLALFVLGFLGLVLGMWPYLLPPSMTLWQAAAPASSLGFTLVGLVILLPVILGYTAWSYRVFRGKVHADTGYH